MVKSLEIAHKTTIVLDKTGTITEGRPIVSNVVANNISEIELLSGINRKKVSQHPIAELIVNYAEINNSVFYEIESFNNIDGFGVSAMVNGKMVIAGNKNLMSQYSINIDDVKSDYEFTKSGKSIVFVAIDGELKGLISIADPIKSTAKGAINIKQNGLEVVMITGDNKRTAESIAAKIGIENYFAEVLPRKITNN